MSCLHQASRLNLRCKWNHIWQLQGGGQKQKPIDAVAEYKCSAINANLKATVGQLSEIEPLVAASNVCLGAREEDAWAAGQRGASDSASEGGAAADRVMAYLGDHQVRDSCALSPE